MIAGERTVEYLARDVGDFCLRPNSCIRGRRGPCGFCQSRVDVVRERQAILAYRAPATLREVGQAMGISHERVRQILVRAGEPIRARSWRR